MKEQPSRQGFPLWILAVIIPAGGALLLCCCGGIGFFAYRSQQATPAAPQQDPPIANAPEQGQVAEAPKKSDDKQPEEKPNLTVIFQHSPRKSVGKLVIRGSPIPPGWQGGAGRVLSLEIGQRENHLSAMLANGKEGQTATLTK